MELFRRFCEKWPELSIDINLATSPHSEAPKGFKLAVAKIREIFDLKPLNGIDCTGTLTDAECAIELDKFLLWCDVLKKNLRTSQTLLQPTEEQKFTSEENQTTPSTSDCGSTETGSCTEKPNQ